MKLNLVGGLEKMSTGRPLNKNYDPECDALMLYYAEEYDYDYSLELTDNVIVDFDKNGIPCAFEFLNASKLIELNTLIVALVHNKAVSNSLQKSHVNNVNIPELNLAFV